MYEFWQDYIKPKYGENAKLCYMKTDRFIVHIKTNDIYKYTPEDGETLFSTSNYELDRPFPRGEKRSNWINQR